MKKIWISLFILFATALSCSAQGAIFVPDNAVDIQYDNDTYPNVDSALDHLFAAPQGGGESFDHTLSDLPLYSTPALTDVLAIVVDPGGTPSIKKIEVGTLVHAADELQITSFVNNKNDLENGTVVTSTILNWAVSEALTSESLDNGVGAVSPASLRAYTHTSTYSTNRTYTLTVGNGSETDTATTAIRFLNSNYYGVSASTTLNSLAVNSLSHNLATSRTQTRTIAATAQYIYIAYPASYGAATFTINGLVNNDWTLSTQNHTNSSGAVVSYRVYRTNNLLTGTYIIGVQ